MDFIEAQQVAYPTIAARYHELGELFSKKLWHQLTLALKKFVNDPTCLTSDNTAKLYSEFISKFEKHLNQLEFALICVQLSRQYGDFASGAIFLEARYEDAERIGTEGSLVLRLELAHLKLCSQVPDQKACRNILEACEKVLEDSSEAIDPVVWSEFYRVRVVYLKTIGDANEYYKAALAYLSFTPLEQIPLKERPILARDLAIAALTSETVYNFGDLLKHPIIKVLNEHDLKWLHEMVLAFNAGDVTRWQRVVQNNKAVLETQPAFSGPVMMDFIKKKIRLMALIELVFRRDPNDRIIPFQDIIVQCHVADDEVEMVVMRALSLGLIQGKIDQVKKTISVTYVVPRTLQMSHVSALVEKTKSWVAKIEQAVDFVQENAGAFRKMEVGEVSA